MDTFVFIVSALTTILWSVWLYMLWQERAGLPEDSAARMILLVAPSSYFFILSISSWARSLSFRLDILGLLALDILTLLCGIAVLVLTRIPSGRRRNFLFTVAVYNGTAVLIISSIYLIRLYPPLLIRVSAFLRQIEEFNFMSTSWVVLNPANHEQDLIGLLNKIIIALCSYIPISVLRMLYVSRQRKRMEKDLVELKSRIRQLEQKAEIRSEQFDCSKL